MFSHMFNGEDLYFPMSFMFLSMFRKPCLSSRCFITNSLEVTEYGVSQEPRAGAGSSFSDDVPHEGIPLDRELMGIDGIWVSEDV